MIDYKSVVGFGAVSEDIDRTVLAVSAIYKDSTKVVVRKFPIGLRTECGVFSNPSVY